MHEERVNVRRFLHYLNVARMRAKVLPQKHNSVVVALTEALEVLCELLTYRERMTFLVVNGEFFLNGFRLPNESMLYHGLLDDLLARELTSVNFVRGITHDELSTFVNVAFVVSVDELASQGGAKQLLRDRDLPHILLDQYHLQTLTYETLADDDAPGYPVAREVYHGALKAVISAYYDAREKQALNMEVIQGIARQMAQGVKQYPDVFQVLCNMKEFSEYTFYHSVNVAIISMLMGAKLRLNDDQLIRLGVAALLHDIGKISVPLEILDKPGRLSGSEIEIIQQHPIESARILGAQKNMDELALVVAAQHHARFDLSGYPDFRGMGKLHFLSHIVSIADTYDALTSNRSYSRAQLPDRAMRLLLNGRGSHFHPALTKVFASLTGLFPVGTLVELDTGELAIVDRANETDLYRPQVKLLSPTHEGSAFFRIVDLTERASDGSYRRSVLRALEPGSRGLVISEVA